MNTIALVLIFLAAVAAKDYSARLVLHYVDDRSAGSVIFSQAEGSDIVGIDLRLNRWPPGYYYFEIQKSSSRLPNCDGWEESERNPLDHHRDWIIFNVDIRDTRIKTIDLAPDRPRSLHWPHTHSILNRSVAILASYGGERRTRLYACGRVSETNNKNAKCGEANPMATLPTSSTTTCTCPTTTEAPVPANKRRRRSSSSWKMCRENILHLFGH